LRQKLPLLLMDNHLPCLVAILRVFGVIKHRRRRKGRGRRRKPTLKAQPGLLVVVVVEGPAQLDACTRFFEGLLSGDGAGADARIWMVLEYIRYPTHISEPQRQLWADQRKDALDSALEKYQRKKSLPTS
jgi:hypothetical protein